MNVINSVGVGRDQLNEFGQRQCLVQPGNVGVDGCRPCGNSARPRRSALMGQVADAVALMIGVDFDTGEVDLGGAVMGDGSHAAGC